MPQKQNVKLPELRYHLRTSAYFMRLDNDRRYIPLDGRTCKLEMMRRGFYIDWQVNDQGLKSGEAELLRAQTESYVDYAGPLAGYRIGFFNTTGGKRVLVTSETKPVEPKKGKLPWFMRFIDGLLSNTDGQVEHVLLWLKFAHESISEGRFTPAQLLVLAGDKGCGKSFMQHIITEFLGGRSSKPWPYLCGKSPRFNSHIAQAEHAYIEDEATETDIRTRRHVGESIKQLTVNEVWNIEGKNQDSISLPFCRRASWTCNREPEKMMSLPPMDGDVSDKISLLNCEKADLDPDRSKNWDAMKKELPALAYYVRELKAKRHKPGCECGTCHDDRYGVSTFHHPALLEMLAGVSPELRLLEFIDQWLFTRRPGEKHAAFKERAEEGFHGPAIVLEKELSHQSNPFQFQVQKLLTQSSTCGTYLARLEKKFQSRISSTRSKGKTTWHITKEDL